ncbi:hypothetical protein L4D20_04760 [Vibrio kyushuensis]|uniref:hypothetical protein n=1 Tax=Vibrio kyushuensis TaxID=2910249 RepID=UPI003D1139E1
MNFSPTKLITSALISTLFLSPQLSAEETAIKEGSTHKQQEKNVDMSDPTAVYSSVGTSMSSDGDIDVSAGFAWGKNLLSIETKQGTDALNTRYAWMTEGKGIYAEAYFNRDTETQSGSVGYIHTFELSETIKIYPLAMVGINNDELSNTTIATGTIGMYTRINIGSGFHLGVDPFYTLGESDHKTHSVDTFVGKQIDNHRVRVGVNSAEEEMYFKWQMAF